MLKKRLTRILRSKSPINKVFTADDLVEIFIKTPQRKRGRWTFARTVFSVDKDSGMITVPGANGMTVKAALEDVRLAINGDALAQLVRNANDVLDNDIEDLIMLNYEKQT